jgi:hypothetical protein
MGCTLLLVSLVRSGGMVESEQPTRKREQAMKSDRKDIMKKESLWLIVKLLLKNNRNI